MPESELPIIQKTYDLLCWYIPHVNKMPRNHRFGLGDRIATSLYEILDGLIRAKFSTSKKDILKELNVQLEILRFQTRLLKEFQVFNNRQYEFASTLILEIGSMLGGWLKKRGRV